MEIETLPPIGSVAQAPGAQAPGVNGQINNQNADTLSSYGCCDAPINLIQGIFGVIVSTLTGIKDWILSLFCMPGMALEEQPDILFRDASVALWRKLENFYYMLRELTEPLTDNMAYFRPDGMSDEEMKREIITLFNTALPQEIKNAIEREFEEIRAFDERIQQNSAFIPIAGFSSDVHINDFEECLAREPLKAKAVVLELMRCQLSYYQDQQTYGICAQSTLLEKLRSYESMLDYCTMDSQLTAGNGRSVQRFFEELWEPMNILSRECLDLRKELQYYRDQFTNRLNRPNLDEAQRIDLMQKLFNDISIFFDCHLIPKEEEALAKLINS